MVRYSQWIADHPRLEKVVYFLLLTAFFISCIEVIFLVKAILPCKSIGDFLALFDDYWVQHAFMGRTVLQFMQYYYAGIHPFFLLMSCFGGKEIFLVFVSLIYLLQVHSSAAMKRRQRALAMIALIQLISLGVFLFFLYRALTSLTTAAGFSNLICGALGYGIGNLFCAGVILAALSLIKEKRKIPQ